MGTLRFLVLIVRVGIMVGSIFVAYLNRGRWSRTSAIGALGMPLVFMGFCLSDPLSQVFNGLCLGLGFGALFFVPLNGYIQDRAQENEEVESWHFQSADSACWYLMILLHAYLSNILG